MTQGTYFYSPDIKVYIECSGVKDKTTGVAPRVVDVSEDIIDFNITRAVNATSTAQITLANANFKYTPGIRNSENSWGTATPIFNMDKIVIYLKKETYIQVFSGYVTTSPVLTLIPQPVVIQASCSLYTIQNTYWDTNIPQMQNLIPGMLMTDSHGGAASYADGGVAQGIHNVLTTVAGWDEKRIHVGSIPTPWVKSVTDAYDNNLNDLSAADQKNLLMQAIDGAGIVAGYNLIKGTGVNSKAEWEGNFKLGYYDNSPVISGGQADTMRIGTSIPAAASLTAVVPPFLYTKDYSAGGVPGIVIKDTEVQRVRRYYVTVAAINGRLGGRAQTIAAKGFDELLQQNNWPDALDPDLINPVNHDKMSDQWWCVLPWEYVNTPGQADNCKTWLSLDGYNGQTGRHILLTSSANANQVVVKVAMFGGQKGQIILSKPAWEALAGNPVTTDLRGNRTGNFYGGKEVQVTAVWAKPGKTVVGPQDTTDLVDKLTTYGVQLGRTAPQLQSTQLEGGVTMTAGEWVDLALGAADLPLSKVNRDFMLRWIAREHKFQEQPWDYRCNPLNMSWLTDSTKGISGSAGTTRGSYPNLYCAAAVFAMLINPNTTWRLNGSALPAAKFPEILAAFADRPEYIIKNPNLTYTSRGTHTVKQPDKYVNPSISKTYKGNYDLVYYWSANWGLAPKTYQKGFYVGDTRGLISDAYANYYGTFWTNGVYNTPGANVEDQYDVLETAVVNSLWSPNHYDRTNSTKNPQGFLAGIEPIDENASSLNKQGSLYGGVYNKPACGPWVQKFVEKQGRVLFPENFLASFQSTGVDISNSTTSFNIAFTPPQLDPMAMVLYGTPRGFVTDQSLLGSISTMAAATLRDFQSAPNGDFICWFPDYFGLYGIAPKIEINPVEIIDFNIYHDDSSLTTHVAAAGDPFSLGGEVGLVQWMQSNGIVSVQTKEVMRQLFGEDVESLFGDNATTFLQRYGLRPRVESVPMIRNHVTEFMYAWRLFMAGWAQTYNTQVQFTFMPELYPGMRIRINLPADTSLGFDNVEVYVQSVTHYGSRAAGFSTTAQVTCPITRKNGAVRLLHYGIPLVG
jgi:hypothetical protein